MLYNNNTSAMPERISCAFFLSLALLLSTPSFASVSTQYEPGSFENGDTIDVSFSLSAGTYGPELSLVLDYAADGFSIDANSNLSVDVTDSPFGEGSSLSSSISVDHVNEKMTITLIRQNYTSVYVEGWVCRGSGSVVVFDETSGHQKAPPSLISNVFPNPARGLTKLYLKGSGLASVNLIDYQAKLVWKGEYVIREGAIKIPLHGLAPGLYHLRVRQAGLMETFTLKVL